ncbi:hypothetical protein AXG89_26805 (plasmid) [Burkholderia sp. PAMC 26561]|nr:hypothetical protein AXG89_25885 [Burkholderia sp. PAMC 26561]AME27529.1 hypothetical protein AXG89_26805 [Burkholderia sp. PAMC 26561]
MEGLLLHVIETLDRQFKWAIMQLAQKDFDLERYVDLSSFSDRIETLSYRVFMPDLKGFVPNVYDPTIAEACLKFRHIYRRAKGIYIFTDMRGRVAENSRNRPINEVHTIQWEVKQHAKKS